MSDGSVLLSTKDNPFNPHTEWEAWYTWDEARYQSLALLGRVIRTSDELPPTLRDEAYMDAINEIVTENVSGMHIKVVGPSKVEAKDD